MRKRIKRLRLPWVLTQHRQAPAHAIGQDTCDYPYVWARDVNWVEDDGTIREGVNIRFTLNGRPSHWSWGSPTHWRPATRGEVAVYESYFE